MREYKTFKIGRVDDASYQAGIGKAWEVWNRPWWEGDSRLVGILKNDENGWSYHDISKQSIYAETEGYIIYNLDTENDLPEDLQDIYFIEKYYSRSGLTFEGEIFIPEPLDDRIYHIEMIRLDHPLFMRSTDDYNAVVYDRPSKRYWFIHVKDKLKCPKTRLFEDHVYNGKRSFFESEVPIVRIEGKRIPLQRGSWWSIIYEDDEVIIINKGGYKPVMLIKE